MQNALTSTVVCPEKQKETLIVKPPIDIIRLHMSCTVTSSYLISMKANQTLKINSLIIFNLILVIHLDCA